MATVYERVKAIVIDKLGTEEASVIPEASFIDDLNADSLDLVEMIMAFEEEFSEGDSKIEISDEAASKIATVKDAVDYLKENGAQDS